MSAGSARRAAGRREAAEAAEAEESGGPDIAGEPLTWRPYEAGLAVLAADDAVPSELVVLDPTGLPVCLAVPITEREFGLLVAVPAAHGNALVGPRHVGAVPATAEDDAASVAEDVMIAVALIGVSMEEFSSLAFLGDHEPVAPNGW